MQIIPLDQAPEFAEICAAWSFGQSAGRTRNETLNDVVKRYKNRAKGKDIIDLSHTWVGLYNNFPAGMVSLRSIDHKDYLDYTPWLASLYVHHNFRRKGYGKRLCHFVEEKAKDIGYKQLYLYTRYSAKFYQGMGYKVITTVPYHLYDDHMVSIMSKDIVNKTDKQNHKQNKGDVLLT